MAIALPPDQLAWIETRVARGDYESVDKAVRDLLATGIAEHEELESIDLSWAKPLVDEALADIDRGNFEIIEDTDAYIAAVFSSSERRWPGSRRGRGRRGISPTSSSTSAGRPGQRSRTIVASTSRRRTGASPIIL